MKILLVEDDIIFAKQLSLGLTKQKFIVETISEAHFVWDYVNSSEYDLLILDVSLPDSDGIFLCQSLRQANYVGAILLLTANDEDTSKVKCLDAGADDYIVKTCTLDELLARIRAVLRRPREIAETILQHGNLQLDPRICKVFYHQREVPLSPKEYCLLELFLRHPQRIFSSHVLLEKLWSFEDTPGEETVRTHIKRLRAKLKQAGVPPIIENVYGMGYCLIASPQDVLESATKLGTTPSLDPPKLPPQPHSQSSTSAAQQAEARKAALSALNKFRGPLQQRLVTIDQFLAALARGDRPAPEQARQAAHKLAGSLGMFGLADGSRVSRQVEALLQSGEQVELAALREATHKLHQAIGPMLASAAPLDKFATSSPVSMAATRLGELPTLLVVSHDERWLADLAAIAPMPVQPLSIADFAQSHLPCTHQDALILLDMAACSADSSWLTYLQRLGDQYPDLPAIVLVEPDTLQVRLDVVRRVKGCMCLPRTTASQTIVDSVIAWHRQRSPAQLHVLAVDDDPLLLAAVQQPLMVAGIQVTPLTDPYQFWDVLHQIHPDLLLLDYEMPDINGIELCQLVRADKQWQHLPIVFLSGQDNSDIIQETYRAGADDYVTKPVNGSELLVRIMNRASLQRRLLL
ncbi:MAG: response regulator [Leptolyngbyaceae cyanobacterium]